MKAKLVKENLNEGFATDEGRKLNRISGWLGYGDFEEFIGDNPGCYQVIVDWIDGQFTEKLIDEQIDVESLESVGLYNTAGELSDEGRGAEEF